MSANIRFLYTFDFDSATITSSSEATNYTDDNVVNDLVGKKWRTTADTAEWLKFDLGAATNIKEIGLFGHNFTSGATIRIEAHATDLWDAPSYSLAMTYNADKMVSFIDQTYRWWRITFADAANPDTYVEVGRVCAGVYYEATVNIENAFARTRHDPSKKLKTEGQQTYHLKKSKYWTYDFSFRLITRTQQESFRTMFDSIGNTEPVVVSLNPDDYPSADSIYAEMTTPLEEAVQLLEMGDVAMAFEEKL